MTKPKVIKEHICIVCKENPPATVRKTDVDKHPRTPHCATHRRAKKRAARASQIDARAVKSYGLPPGHYEMLKEAQNGRCFICQKATGAARALSVDHDHDLAKLHDHEVDKGCEECVRALLCRPCNNMVGFLGVDALLRAALVLTDPPYQRLRNGLELRWM